MKLKKCSEICTLDAINKNIKTNKRKLYLIKSSCQYIQNHTELFQFTFTFSLSFPSTIDSESKADEFKKIEKVNKV